MVYLSRNERKLVGAPLKNELNEEWLELLDRFGCKNIPIVGVVREVIIEVAHKELLEGPQLHRCCSLVENCRVPRFFCKLFSLGTPTNRKLIGLSEAEAETNA